MSGRTTAVIGRAGPLPIDDERFCDFPDIPAGAVGRFMLQQVAAIAELEAGLISERTKAALAARWHGMGNGIVAQSTTSFQGPVRLLPPKR